MRTLELVPRPRLPHLGFSSLRLSRVPAPTLAFSILLVSLGLAAATDGANANSPAAASKRLAGLSAGEDVDLRVLDWTLWNISKYYVDPSRIDPQRMTMAGIEALELALPEILCEQLDHGKRVRVRVGTNQQEFPTDVQALWAVRTHLRAIFGYVQKHVKLDDEKRSAVEYKMVEEILATLDPHTNLLRPDAFESMRDSTKGSFGGLGIEVGIRENEITVLRVLDGNPAAKVGIKAGDRIVEIADESAIAMDLDQAVSLMRGEPGSAVRLVVKRDGEDKPRRFDVTRAVIKMDSVNYDILPANTQWGKQGKIGIARLQRSFAQTTGAELRAALKKFEKEKVDGVILDMRGNPGGLLDAAVEVSDAFLNTGTIVSTVGASSERSESRATDAYDFPNVPVAVLIDPSSASATEIVAGALRNLDRAIIVGQRSFGKGSVQVLHERQNGADELALKLTIAQYLTPGDVSIQSVGVSPDLETRPVWMGKDAIAYYSTKRLDALREESLTAHLKNASARAQQITAGPLYFLDDHDPDESEVSAAAESDKNADPRRVETFKDAKVRSRLLLADPEIRIARDFISWAPSGDRQQLLPRLQEFERIEAELEDDRIVAAMAKRKIDWTAGPVGAPDTPVLLTPAIKSDAKENTVAAGKNIVITVSLTNHSKRPAYRVHAMTASDSNRLDQRELFFGKIGPGETKTSSFTVSTEDWERTQSNLLDVNFFEEHGVELSQGAATSLNVSIQELARPQFSFGYQVVDQPSLAKGVVGNGDGMLQVGEKVQLRVWVKNSGKGDAPDVRVHLRSAAGEALFMTSAREKIGALPAGKQSEVVFPFEVKRLPRDGVAKIRLYATDDQRLETSGREFELPVAVEGDKWISAESKLVANADTFVVVSPHANDAPLAWVRAGTPLRATASHDNWLRVLVGGHMGFIQKSATTSGPANGKGETLTAFVVSPPVIEIVEGQSQTELDSVHLSGTIRDTEHVRDMYITVDNPARNPMGNAAKVFYQASTDPNAKKLDFAADVPLEPGNNVIRVVAREDDDVIATDMRWVLRTSGMKEASEKAALVDARGQLPTDTLRH